MTDPVPYFTDVEINGRWRLQLPDFRALRYATAGPLGWERERLASMHVNLVDTDVLLDVGAESGDMSALFARWVGHIALMEPNQTVWPNIRAIFEVNGIPAPCAHWVGFAAETTSDPLDPDVAAALERHSTWPACADPELPLVAAHGTRHLTEHPANGHRITIDDFVERSGIPTPTAVTMDVEGAELQALAGARRLLTEHRPLVWVSVHPQLLRHHYDQVPADVYAYLESLDYRVTHLADDHETHIMGEPR